MDVDDEVSIFPDRCPVSGYGFMNCVTGGCKFLRYTLQRKYVYCGHPERDQYISAERSNRQKELRRHWQQKEEGYAALLWKASRKWGLDAVYAECVPTVESFETKLGPQPNEIRMFTLNGLWGFSMSIDGGDLGFGYSSFLKFCEPYPTREDAIDGAILYIEQQFAKANAKHLRSKAVLAWAQGLRQASRQLKLF